MLHTHTQKCGGGNIFHLAFKRFDWFISSHMTLHGPIRTHDVERCHVMSNDVFKGHLMSMTLLEVMKRSREVKDFV